MQAAVADPANHRYPTNRGREEFREAFTRFYSDRFGEVEALYRSLD